MIPTPSAKLAILPSFRLETPSTSASNPNTRQAIGIEALC
jgi:hypothetical protein